MKEEVVFSCKSSLNFPGILKVLLAAQDFLMYSTPIICKIASSVLVCYTLKFMSIDRWTDVQKDCNDVSLETK